MAARSIHYAFAHELLPQLFFFNAEEVHSGLASGGSQHLRGLWNWLEEKRGARQDASGLSGDWFAGSDRSGLFLVEMPRAEESPEARFVAPVWGPDARPLRFLALEKGGAGDPEFLRSLGLDPAEVGPEPDWVLGEWLLSNGSLIHTNHGEAAADRTAFLQAVGDKLGISFRPVAPASGAAAPDASRSLIARLRGWFGR